MTDTQPSRETAILAGGCFWCVAADLEQAKGVQAVTSGYAENNDIGTEDKGAANAAAGLVEAVEVQFDPLQTSYAEIVNLFLRRIDPTDGGGQFADRGSQYAPAIFYGDEVQRRIAEESLRELEESGRLHAPLAIRMLPTGPFHVAEAGHQGYHRKNPLQYAYYRRSSGRDQFLHAVWGSPEAAQKHTDPTTLSKEEVLRRRLTPEQHHVTRGRTARSLHFATRTGTTGRRAFMWR